MNAVASLNGILMKYRLFGNTGLKVSELGVGCGSVGGLFVRGTHSEMLRTMNQAIDLGINYFDTASSYGNGKSESNLGSVIQELGSRAKDLIIGTKVRLMPSDLNRIPNAVKESVDQSLNRLRLNCIDLIQLHNPISLQRDPKRGYLGLADLETVINTFKALQANDKVKFYGITGLGETNVLLQAIHINHLQSIQICYNMLNPSASQTVPSTFPFQNFNQLMHKASKQGLGVIAIRILAGGALIGTIKRHPNAALPSPIGTEKTFEKDVNRAQLFRFIVDEGYTESLHEAAIRFAISNPKISTALIGVSDHYQLEEAAEFVAKGPLPQLALKRLDACITKMRFDSSV